MKVNSERVELEQYITLLTNYINTQSEKDLYKAVQMSKSLLKQGVPPEEVVNLHFQAMESIFQNLSPKIQHAMDFLLEVMISYGLDYQKTHRLEEKQHELQTELAIAANMQQSLLATDKPTVEGLDIGVISVPAGQMNGDYYHFIRNGDGPVGIALADVIGKGVPAALCMSMIKYSMESYPKDMMMPSTILENLNRVVEKNIEPGMFITMFYGQYLSEISLLRYASAGHEPGVYYSQSSGSFTELKTKGLVLGVLPNSAYKQYKIKVLPGDLVILFTDGVTECRADGRFLKREEILTIIKKYIHLPAQQIVENVYKHLERLQDFQLNDDFTLVVLKKNV